MTGGSRGVGRKVDRISLSDCLVPRVQAAATGREAESVRAHRHSSTHLANLPSFPVWPRASCRVVGIAMWGREGAISLTHSLTRHGGSLRRARGGCLPWALWCWFCSDGPLSWRWVSFSGTCLATFRLGAKGIVACKCEFDDAIPSSTSRAGTWRVDSDEAQPSPKRGCRARHNTADDTRRTTAAAHASS